MLFRQLTQGADISSEPVSKQVRIKSTGSMTSAQTKRTSNKKQLSVRRYIKFGIVSVVILGVTGSHLVGRVSSESQYVSPQARLDNPIEVPQSQPVDAIIAAEVSAVVAQEADLLVTTSVANRADTLSAQVNTSTQTEKTTTAVIEKPQLVAPTSKTVSDIQKVTVKEGDSLPGLSEQYGVSEDTIRWANDLRSDVLNVGSEITVLPVSGVLHTVSAADTVDSIAQQYQATAEQITAFNDLELSGLKEGAQIVVPNGVKPAPIAQPSRRSSTSSPSSAAGFSFGDGGAVYAGNSYAYGYCTYYAYNKRAAAGKVIGSNWGNATTWASLARASGFAVDKTPRAGDVFQSSGGWGGYGHVGYVEGVNEDGSIYVSEMNYAGWNRVSTRTISASQVSSFNYIH